MSDVPALKRAIRIAQTGTGTSCEELPGFILTLRKQTKLGAGPMLSRCTGGRVWVESRIAR
jgi:hypothetical protein